jgi:hypothetical protein
LRCLGVRVTHLGQRFPIAQHERDRQPLARRPRLRGPALVAVERPAGALQHPAEDAEDRGGPGYDRAALVGGARLADVGEQVQVVAVQRRPADRR